MAQSTASKVNETSRSAVGRDGVLDIAARLFREQGYGSVSLRKIAEAAGIKAGSIYYHFGSKDEIVAAVLDAGIRVVHASMRDAITDLPADTDGETILRSAIRAHLRALLDVSDYTSANVRIFGQVPQSVRDANLPTRRAYEAEWDSLLSQLKKDGTLKQDVDIRRLRLMLIGTLNATLDWFDPDRGSADALSRTYADVFLNGILQRQDT
ncbi:TetR family transcriptional regulator (plasmid) [Sagittula sp. P11]|jgi:AcrR family transcriptional regulator|uniref:TetR family transcriptional regulator n=2 Tax=Paracoccaceae TaxID=31989 RepID=A0A225NDD8_9RHOB|nr:MULTISPECIES: TetR/AcrR family transcriptional regulator [Rhodobacterales]MCS5601924.1 TetR/AcrR family transcriptional regulator [Paracoccus sp. (in: a-proteobacteria)]OJY32564.1 MAG: TetR family transcriptional regulator [Rhodobacterales bacterium 65-51]AUC56354.1 TetR family transcriptional regulator [Sagittula sp. P11]MCR8549954.1 TetR/AcrR family transcriptional regulator [Salipiger pentaromativorans]OOY03416.1 TetR family transcriptional regulator [Thioclava sp. F28-4]